MAGTSNYPGSLDNFAASSPTNLGDNDATGRTHAERHDDLEAAMEAVQAELGTDPAGAAASVKARFEAIEANNWVTNARMADNAVGTAELIDGAINIAKLGSTATTKNLLTANQASVETDTTGLGINNGGTCSRSTAQALHGSASLLTAAASGWTAAGMASDPAVAVPVVSGRTYTGVISAKSVSITTSAYARIVWYSAANTVVSIVTGTAAALSSSVWKEYRITAVAPANAVKAIVQLEWNAGSGDAVYLDCLGLWEGAGGTWVEGGDRLDPAKLGYLWDESVGRRLFVWDTINNRWQMVYGDTGWRDISASCNVVAGQIITIARIRRIGSRVTVQLQISNSATSVTTLYTLPTGFRPNLTYLTATGTRQNAFNASDTITGIAESGGSLKYTCANAFTFLFEMSWDTINAWPDSLPGTASGSIPET